MSSPAPILLTKVAGPTAALRSVARAGSLPPVLLEKVPVRLRILALLLLVLLSISWLGVNLFEGQLADELENFYQWGGPVGMIVASALVLVLTTGSRVAPRTLVSVGLVFQVVVSWCLCVGSYWRAFVDVPVEYFTGDRVGLSPVVMWMVIHTVLVPARPRSALIALLSSAAAVPTVYGLNVHYGLAPALPRSEFFTLFVLPYLLVAAASYVVARVVFNLGADVRRARELGSYKLRSLLGRGGMGEVWRADHALLARSAAIKLIQPELLARSDDSVDTAISRFEREAQITASLQSPHSVALYDFGRSADGTLYYVMELLDGMDLQTLVDEHEPLPPARVIHILRQCCASLEEAHRQGLVHRDIKPANLLLCRWAGEHDFVKVLDFGLAKQHTAKDETSTTGGTELTLANVVVGTPAYLAPEVALGNVVPDGRADLYALGCVAYWLLVGRPVFDADSPMAMAVAHIKDEPPSPSDHLDERLPAELEELVLSCLAKQPDDRPASAAELARRLTALADANPWSEGQAAAWWAAHQPADASAKQAQ
ncbi:MAG: serine/threonine protein kinase [Deltaproteobacteria bacterium]|nr:serine/threonine protein kinase [Deltaproteobacteria bacterium]